MILLNNKLNDFPEFSEKIFEDSLSIYEVIRIFKGKPIFLEDNLIRLNNSLNKLNIDIQIETLNIPDKLDRFIRQEQITEGNLKYVLHFTTSHTDEYIFQIPHSYPTAEDYLHGITTITHPAVRENPGVKYINANLRTQTNQLIRQHGVYEILLVDNDGYITEGSRSNVFFIKNNILYTSPLEYVLPGTSRKRVFDICNEHKISIEEKRIACDELNEYEAAFLTGTSPLILPINRIDNIVFNSIDSLLQTLMQYYFKLIGI
ncbi:MAG: aminotransferase class IV [Odoribacter sp.]